MVLPPSRSVKLGRKVKSILAEVGCVNLPGTNLPSNIVVQRANHLNVVTRHDHLFLSVSGTLRPRQPRADISGTEEELRRVVGHERSVTATLVLSENLQTTVRDTYNMSA